MITFTFLSSFGSVLLFVLIICFLIAWHELGHLVAAKKCNVYCYEYSIGFGPVLYKNKKRETHFCIRAIPFGGFVKMAGEEGLEDGEEVKDNNDNIIPSNRILANQSLGKRALVMAAGGLMNLLLALICFYFYVSFNKPYADSDKTGFVEANHKNIVLVAEDESYPLCSLGMETGDKIIEISTKLVDGEEVVKEKTFKTKSYDAITKALKYNTPSKNSQVEKLTIKFEDASKNNELKTIYVERVLEEKTDENGNVTHEVSKLGIGQDYIVHEYNALTGLYGVWHFMGYYTVEICRAFGKIFTGDFGGLSGFIGIYSTVDTVATAGGVPFSARFLNMIYLIGAISFSLGFFNLIPFPALDGGRLFFVGIEAIFKKKVKPNIEASIHSIGFILLFVLMIVINARDLINLFR